MHSASAFVLHVRNFATGNINLHVISKKIYRKHITCKNQNLFASLFKFCFFQNDKKLHLFERSEFCNFHFEKSEIKFIKRSVLLTFASKVRGRKRQILNKIKKQKLKKHITCKTNL